MRRVRILASARKDIAAVYSYIEDASGSGPTARRFTRTLTDKCRQLGRLSVVLGRPRSELAPGLRSYVFENYLILMRYEEKTLDIVNVIESHRDLEALFRKGE